MIISMIIRKISIMIISIIIRIISLIISIISMIISTGGAVKRGAVERHGRRRPRSGLRHPGKLPGMLRRISGQPGKRSDPGLGQGRPQ
jgi:hypothetical protein